MNVKHVEAEKGFDVIGITIRTTNKAAIANGTIGKLWQQFFAESILSQIQNKIDNAVVAVYYDFENDKNGEYNVLIGARVSSVDNIPAGMVAQHVPIQKRTIFISEPGPISQIVFDLWKKIWILEDQNKINRAYTIDYELYDERSQDPQNAQIEIHIGTK